MQKFLRLFFTGCKKFVKEKGCVKPLHGVKSKCVIKIVPKDKKCSSFQMDPKCKLRRV